jgi:Tfp pilus assembly protein PilN
MADMDMIPRSYRDALRVRRTLFAYGGALALVLAAGVAGTGWLHWRLAAEQASLDQLRAASASAEAMRSQVAAAQQRKNSLEQASEALAALHGGGTVARLSGALDAALNERTSFSSMHFSRSHELLKAPLPDPLPEGTVQTQGAGTPEYWRLANRVEINGSATDHAALTQFLDAMSKDPTLSDIRFLNSAAAAGGHGSGLSFSVAGFLRSNGVKP